MSILYVAGRKVEVNCEPSLLHTLGTFGFASRQVYEADLSMEPADPPSPTGRLFDREATSRPLTEVSPPGSRTVGP